MNHPAPDPPRPWAPDPPGPWASDPPGLWTGMICLDLLEPDDRHLTGGIEMHVRVDALHVSAQTRLLATLDRERFTSWITHPYVRYSAGDTTWTASNATITLTIDDVAYVVAGESLSLLTAALHHRLPTSPGPRTPDPRLTPDPGPGPDPGLGWWPA